MAKSKMLKEVKFNRDTVREALHDVNVSLACGHLRFAIQGKKNAKTVPQALRDLKKLIDSNIRVYVVEGEVHVFHGFDWQDLPVGLKMVADYAELVKRGKLAKVTKSRHGHVGARRKSRESDAKAA